MNKASFNQMTRIILAIAGKDTLDALKNRTILVLMLSVLSLMVSAKALPLLLAAQGTPTLAVYDPTGSFNVQALSERNDIRVIPVNSQQELESLLVESQQLIIGLVLPADFRQIGGEVVLDGYTAHWVNPARVRETLTLFENVLSSTSGVLVQIEVEEHVIYPGVATGKHLSMVVQTAMVLITLMGIVLVPYLFLEEKENRTLDALLVSPVTFNQMVTGKALAGMVYCLVASLVIVLFNFRLIVHWEILGLAVLLGSIFAVMTGLLLGVLVENQAVLGMWMGVVMIILIGPAVMMSFGFVRLEPVIEGLLSWTPGVAFSNLLKISMCMEVPLRLVGQDVTAMIIGTLIVYTLVILRVRRLDR